MFSTSPCTLRNCVLAKTSDTKSGFGRGGDLFAVRCLPCDSCFKVSSFALIRGHYVVAEMFSIHFDRIRRPEVALRLKVKYDLSPEVWSYDRKRGGVGKL